MHVYGKGMAYDDLTEWQLLGRLQATLLKIQLLPVGSVSRAMEWAAFDALKAEMDARVAKAIEQAARQARKSAG